MPAWIAFVVPFIIEKLMQTFQMILNAYNLVADRFADSGFSLFISLETENEKLKEELLEQYYNWLKLAVNLCPAHIFIMYNYEVIQADEDLKRFLMSDEYLKKVYESVDKSFKEGARAKDLAEFLKSALIDTPLSFILGAWEQLIANPITMFNEICSRLIAYINEHPTEEQVAVNKFLSQFTPDKVPDRFLVIGNEIIAKINPFLAILSPQILAHIKALYAYSKVIHYKPCPQPPRQLLDFLDCDVYLDGKHEAIIKLREDNTLTIEIPKEKITPIVWHEIKFDYAGLTKSLKFRYGKVPKLYVTDFGFGGYMSCYRECSLKLGDDMANWTGDCRIDCTTFYGDSYSLLWIEMENNMGDAPFYLRVYVGAYREACIGTAKLYVGYREGDKLYLTPVTDIWGTWLNPSPITLYGRFPGPRFVIALYHYCYQPTLSVTGVRIIKSEAWTQ
jgi:hypothetical protein